MKHLYYLILIALTTVSCKTTFRISVIEPAVVNMPDSVNRLGVINNVTKFNSPEKKVNEVLNRLNGNVMASERAVEGVLRALSDSQMIRGEIVQDDSMRNDFGELYWPYLDSVAVLNNWQGYIVLNELKTISPIGGGLLANATGTSSNRLDGTLYIDVHIVESGERFERLAVRETYKIPVSGSTNIFDILNDAQRRREYYRALGFQLGYEAGRLVYPNWVWVGRTYYTRGNKTLKGAKQMIRNGNWDIAERQLIKDVNSDNLKIRGRILFNLGLVKEGQGDIDEAIRYAEMSALDCSNKEANHYLKKLRKRQVLMEQE